MADLYGGCCTINGSCTTPENAMQNGTCYLIIFIIIFSVLVIVSAINLIGHSDIELLVIGSLIHIAVNSIQILQILIILFNRRNLLSLDCSLPCCRVISMITSIMVLGPTVSLSIISHSDESRTVDPDTGMETYG